MVTVRLMNYQGHKGEDVACEIFRSQKGFMMKSSDLHLCQGKHTSNYNIASFLCSTTFRL